MPELKAELKSRMLSVGGKVQELRDRLTHNDLKVNQALADKDQIKKRPNCDNCSDFDDVFINDAPSYYICEDCEENLCKRCHDAHRRTKVTRNHTVLPLPMFRPINPINQIESFDLIERRLSKITIGGEFISTGNVDSFCDDINETHEEEVNDEVNISNHCDDELQVISVGESFIKEASNNNSSSLESTYQLPTVVSSKSLESTYQQPSMVSTFPSVLSCGETMLPNDKTNVSFQMINSVNNNSPKSSTLNASPGASFSLFNETISLIQSSTSLLLMESSASESSDFDQSFIPDTPTVLSSYQVKKSVAFETFDSDESFVRDTPALSSPSLVERPGAFVSNTLESLPQKITFVPDTPCEAFSHESSIKIFSSFVPNTPCISSSFVPDTPCQVYSPKVSSNQTCVPETPWPTGWKETEKSLEPSSSILQETPSQSSKSASPPSSAFMSPLLLSATPPKTLRRVVPMSASPELKSLQPRTIPTMPQVSVASRSPPSTSLPRPSPPRSPPSTPLPRTIPTMPQVSVASTSLPSTSLPRMSGFPTWVDYLKAVAAATK